MKKSIAFILILLLLCALSACGDPQSSSANGMEGSYRLVDAAGEGSKDLLKIKDGVHLVIRSDNSANLSLMTDTHELFFDEASKICTSSEDSQKVPFTFDGKRLVMDTESFRMVFEKE